MSWLDASRSPAVLAVIPARGGSKGIPGKNMKRLCGLTLVGRATRLAVSQTWVDQVIVSTDDPEIAAEVVRQGGDAPFLRPPELADDTASSDDMWNKVEATIAGVPTGDSDRLESKTPGFTLMATLAIVCLAGIAIQKRRQ